MYIVAKYFTDLQDNDHPYKVGETFPREGFDVTEERLAELASANNKRGEVLIKAVKDEVPEAPAETPAAGQAETAAVEPAAEPKANTKAKGKASGK